MDYNKLTPEQKRQMERLKNVSQQYRGKSESELMNELKRAASQGKSNGTLSNQKMDKFAKQIAPMLDENQKKKLNRILSELKK